MYDTKGGGAGEEADRARVPVEGVVAAGARVAGGAVAVAGTVGMAAARPVAVFEVPAVR